MQRVFAAAQGAQAAPHLALRPGLGLSLSILTQIRKYSCLLLPRGMVGFLEECRCCASSDNAHAAENKDHVGFGRAPRLTEFLSASSVSNLCFDTSRFHWLFWGSYLILVILWSGFLDEGFHFYTGVGSSVSRALPRDPTLVSRRYILTCQSELETQSRDNDYQNNLYLLHAIQRDQH